MEQYDELEEFFTKELNKRFKSFTTDPKIVEAQRTFDLVVSKLLVGLAMISVLLVAAAIFSAKLENLALLISVYVVGMVALLGYLVYGLRKMHQAHLLVIQAIDDIGQENRQIIDDYFKKMSEKIANIDSETEGEL